MSVAWHGIGWLGQGHWGTGAGSFAWCSRDCRFACRRMGSGMPAIMFYCWVKFGGTAWWLAGHPLVGGEASVCSGLPAGWVAMLGCSVFLVWVGESQTKSRMSQYFLSEPKNLRLSADGGPTLVSFAEAIWSTPYSNFKIIGYSKLTSMGVVEHCK